MPAPLPSPVWLAPVWLAPVWLVQGAWVALRTPRLPEAAGPRAGRIGAGRLRLLIAGDSSAAGVGAATQEAALAGQLAAALAGHEPAWALHARIGATTAATRAHLAALPAEPFDAAVLALGVNDLTRGVRLDAWLAAQAGLWALLAERFGVRRIYATGVPPMGAFPALPRPLRGVLGGRAARFDAALADLVAQRPGVRHLRFDQESLTPDLMAPDGFHPGPEAYARWAQALARAIASDFPATVPA